MITKGHVLLKDSLHTHLNGVIFVLHLLPEAQLVPAENEGDEARCHDDRDEGVDYEDILHNVNLPPGNVKTRQEHISGVDQHQDHRQAHQVAQQPEHHIVLPLKWVESSRVINVINPIICFPFSICCRVADSK